MKSREELLREYADNLGGWADYTLALQEQLAEKEQLLLKPKR